MKSIDLKSFSAMNMVVFFALIVLSNIFIGYLIGWVISYFTAKKIFIVIFMFLGIISGMYSGVKELLKEADRYDKLQSKKDKRKI